ncbi:MAG TPA: pilus assembly protein TadG-related protein [Candidatus Acidoferrales bacterium]|nr:pilus assembly protein TadG-related protein [Candidatus Acidoferrales bacterium]
MNRHPTRSQQRTQRGQVMVLFGLFAILLFVIGGLAVDAGMSYLNSDRAERAAAAAALAGVAFLPGDYPSAQNAALVEAGRNGFVNAGASNACGGNPSPCVTTSQPATNQLKVNVSVTVQTTFLRLVGFGTHTVTRSATAEYLPPIQIGQPGAQQGSDMTSGCDGVPSSGTYCTSPASGLGSGGSNFYFLRQEGWGNPRSEGDPFTPSPNQSGFTASPPDIHLISPWNGTENSDATLNYVGGANYLIDVPPGQKADVQVYNPSFAPDNHDQNGGYSYHEYDGSFPGDGANKTQYSTMAYTTFTAPTLSSRLSDTKVRQLLFYPYNASGLYGQSGAGLNYFWFPPGTGTQTTVNAYVPVTYHAWTSVIQYSPANVNDQNLRKDVYNTLGSGYLDNTGGTVDKYWRLRVDSLDWKGGVTCSSTVCTTPSTASANDSTAHKGYSVRVVNAPTATCASCTISAMSDMTIFTPIKSGASAAQFPVPLFKLDPAYAGQTITFDVFDPGDVGGGSAYMGIQLPNSTSFATATSMTLLGNSLGSGGTASVGYSTSPTGCDGSTSACFQSANSGGGAIYNGQWIQVKIKVPSSFDTSSGGTTKGYWDMVYSVAANVTAGDTLGFQVGFNGSPDHLLP